MPNDHVKNDWSHWKANKKIKCRPNDKNAVNYVGSKLYIKEWHWFERVFLHVLCLPFYVKVDAYDNECCVR